MSSVEIPQPHSVFVVADDRESASPVPEALRQIPGVELRMQRLRVGDYEVERRCVFERKTILDFAASVIDGRLFMQAQKLAHLDLPSALILEGRPSQLAATNVRREALQGAMISLGIIFHLPVLRSVDASETTQLIVYAGQQLQRHESFNGMRHGRRPKNRRGLQLHILQGLPGIGPTRAEQLLERFGNVQAVIDAKPEELSKVGGLGPRTAIAIRDALHEFPPAYGNAPSPEGDI